MSLTGLKRTSMFLQELNAYTIPVGFGLDDERIHSPNGFTRLDNCARFFGSSQASPLLPPSISPLLPIVARQLTPSTKQR